VWSWVSSRMQLRLNTEKIVKLSMWSQRKRDKGERWKTKKTHWLPPPPTLVKAKSMFKPSAPLPPPLSPSEMDVFQASEAGHLSRVQSLVAADPESVRQKKEVKNDMLRLSLTFSFSFHLFLSHKPSLCPLSSHSSPLSFPISFSFHLSV